MDDRLFGGEEAIEGGFDGGVEEKVFGGLGCGTEDEVLSLGFDVGSLALAIKDFEEVVEAVGVEFGFLGVDPVGGGLENFSGEGVAEALLGGFGHDGESVFWACWLVDGGDERWG